jgi:hypothetical protein
MASGDLEKQIEELKKQVAGLKERVTRQDDIEAIEKMQKSYGYFIQNWMYQEIIDLFADGPETELNLMVGIYCGKEGVSRYYCSLKDYNDEPEFLHQLMQLSGIIDVAADGKTATGRWFTLGAVAMTTPDGVRPIYANGLYDMNYIKQNGVWKILKLTFHPLFMTPPGEAWVKKERITKSKAQLVTAQTAKPDKPRDVDSRYPTGYIVPFQFKHPVTGKKISVTKRNTHVKRKSPK